MATCITRCSRHPPQRAWNANRPLARLYDGAMLFGLVRHGRCTQSTYAPLPPSSNLLCKPGTHSGLQSKVQYRRACSVAAPALTQPDKQNKNKQQVYIGLGSNIMPLLSNIEAACTEIDRLPGTRIVRTSGLYRTKAMYVTDQADFLNGVCQVETDLDPIDLLDGLQGIEKRLKRRKLIDKGPRSIDLDILLYGDAVFEHERLCIPHRLMLEREFVLRPLCEYVFCGTTPLLTLTLKNGSLIAERSPPKGFANGTFRSHLIQLKSAANPALTFLSDTFPPLTYTASQSPPLIMSILNLTPDSFSDGGLHYSGDLDHLTRTITGMLASGASIIDIGGESTRPGAEPVSPQVELDRILPGIKIASDLCSHGKGVVSVDTYHADVADQALRVGAHLINDISAGSLDPNMLPVIAKHGASVILMHTRGSPQNMFLDVGLLDYGKDIIATIQRELAERVEAAQMAGIRRWRILVDAGFGFAKNYQQNLELLDRLSELGRHPSLLGLVWVAGISRKNFVKRMAGYDPTVHHDGKVISQFAQIGTSIALKKVLRSQVGIVRVHDPGLAKRVMSG